MTLSYVIIVPVFMAAIMVIAQAAVWYLAKSAALAAARQGVDAARVPHSSVAAGVRAARGFAESSAPGFLLNPRASGTGGNTIVITVTGKVPSLVPGLPINVSQDAQAPRERFTTP
ncbi:MAG TPA: pilus assembly protein [Streptosporangiaceae bacterium]|jgi:hypothetical protein